MNTLSLDIGDVGVVVDAFGVPTGDLRIGTGDQVGGFVISGAVGAGTVTSVNGQTGAVSLALDSLSDVSAAAPTVGQTLTWGGAAWTPSSITSSIATLSDVQLSGLSGNQQLRWDAGLSRWVNFTPVNTGGSDNLGNHTATQNLNLSGNLIFGASELRLTNGWTLLDTAADSIVFEKFNGSVDVPIWSLRHTGTVGSGFLALADYGSLRPDDSGSVALDNLVYFQGNGVLRKASRSGNPNAFKAIPADAFGSLSFAGAAVGNVLTWNGTTFAPAPPAGVGSVTSVNGQVGAVSLSLDNLTTVSAAAPSVGQVLRWGGTNWSPSTPTVAGLSEVAAAAPHATNEVIGWNGSAFTVQPQRILGSADVQAGTPTGGQALVWNQSLQLFQFVDCLITLFTTPVAPGSLMVMNAAGNAWVQIPPGMNGQVLRMVNDTPTWSA